jgi:hypothetical protein
MPASPSSRIDPAIGHLAALGQSLVDERSDVLSVLGRPSALVWRSSTSRR